MNHQEIAARMSALSVVTGLNVMATDAAGHVIERAGEDCEYCRIFRRYLPCGETCEQLHMMAGRRAQDIGEAYMFLCHAGVCHIALPIVNGSAFEGSLLVGPFILGELDSLLVQDVARRYPIPPEALIGLYESAGALKPLSAQKAGALSKLVDALFGEHEEEMADARRAAQEQRRIGETIQMYKGFQTSAPAYPYEKERELIACVSAGQAREANAVLNELLGYALFSSGGGVETVKIWTAELCSLLSRAAIECGVDAADALRLNHSFMKTLWDTGSIDELCHFMRDALSRFCASVFPSGGTGDRALIARCVRYINLHFGEQITLSTLAREAHLSESYFSTRFRRVTGTTFRAYLNGVRVEEAKRLLRRDDLNVTEIALQVGFDTQSYFSKVFHRLTGMTPKQYRVRLREQKDTIQ